LKLLLFPVFNMMCVFPWVDLESAAGLLSCENRPETSPCQSWKSHRREHTSFSEIVKRIFTKCKCFI
jgi:hypothetical protein